MNEQVILARIEVETVVTYHLAKAITVDVISGQGLGRHRITTNALRVHKNGLNRYMVAWLAKGDEPRDRRGEWKGIPTSIEEVMFREIDSLVGTGITPPAQGRPSYRMR